MARVEGVDLPINKRIVIALTYILGIGKSQSKKILKKLNIDENIRVNQLTEEQLSHIRNEIISSKIIVEGELRSKVFSDIKRLIEIRCDRGINHRRGLPVNGQHTKNNAKTAKRNRTIKLSLNNNKNIKNNSKRGI
ncbi:30S ribosomal protein S13 [Texas Phoenix palm phytoplasma]|uniref:Small ribosomal subunit protein uS13 n=1 Tax=Texas Phoenix palm phytoplasma TaxID=176709 RepID=A0ABS5BII2_9MOLU|nr:30S ribosomal protein S13 [Texas Phoenix palm phytoplasma]MBP3059395.1 30S ribosomal protein S13 [Texas Phoenix palm phytoplasma]